MTPKLKDIVQIICVACMVFGIVAFFIKSAIWFNTIWSYPIGLGLSILTVLGGFEIIERSREK